MAALQEECLECVSLMFWQRHCTLWIPLLWQSRQTTHRNSFRLSWSGRRCIYLFIYLFIEGLAYSHVNRTGSTQGFKKKKIHQQFSVGVWQRNKHRPFYLSWVLDRKIDTFFTWKDKQLKVCDLWLVSRGLWMTNTLRPKRQKWFAEKQSTCFRQSWPLIKYKRSARGKGGLLGFDISKCYLFLQSL